MTPLDGYLAGFIAYTTMIGLAGRHRWQTAVWLIFGAYALVNLSLHTTVLSLLITLLVGRRDRAGVRYAAGLHRRRPTAEEIAAALGTAGCPVARDAAGLAAAGAESRRYAATAPDGDQLDVDVYDQDQQAAGALYRLYRWSGCKSRRRTGRRCRWTGPWSGGRCCPTRRRTPAAHPRLRAAGPAGPEAAMLAHEHHDGTTLADHGREPTDAELDQIWAPCASCTRTASRTGRSPPTASCSPTPAGSCCST